MSHDPDPGNHDPDLTDYVARHAHWFGAGFGVFLLLGILAENWAALAGGIAGLIWLAWRTR